MQSTTCFPTRRSLSANRVAGQTPQWVVGAGSNLFAAARHVSSEEAHHHDLKLSAWSSGHGMGAVASQSQRAPNSVSGAGSASCTEIPQQLSPRAVPCVHQVVPVPAIGPLDLAAHHAGKPKAATAKQVDASHSRDTCGSLSPPAVSPRWLSPARQRQQFSQQTDELTQRVLRSSITPRTDLAYAWGVAPYDRTSPSPVANSGCRSPPEEAKNSALGQAQQGLLQNVSELQKQLSDLQDVVRTLSTSAVPTVMPPCAPATPPVPAQSVLPESISDTSRAAPPDAAKDGHMFARSESEEALLTLYRQRRANKERLGADRPAQPDECVSSCVLDNDEEKLAAAARATQNLITESRRSRPVSRRGSPSVPRSSCCSSTIRTVGRSPSRGRPAADSSPSLVANGDGEVTGLRLANGAHASWTSCLRKDPGKSHTGNPPCGERCAKGLSSSPAMVPRSEASWMPPTTRATGSPTLGQGNSTPAAPTVEVDAVPVRLHTSPRRLGRPQGGNTPALGFDMMQQANSLYSLLAYAAEVKAMQHEHASPNGSTDEPQREPPTTSSEHTQTLASTGLESACSAASDVVELESLSSDQGVRQTSVPAASQGTRTPQSPRKDAVSPRLVRTQVPAQLLMPVKSQCAASVKARDSSRGRCQINGQGVRSRGGTTREAKCGRNASTATTAC